MKNVFTAAALTVGVTSLILISVVQAAFAQTAKEKFNTGLSQTAQSVGYTTAADDGGEGFLPNKIGEIIQVALSFLGVIFLLLMIYGGFIWMFARGSEEQTGKAKKIIGGAVVGLIIVLAAYAVTAFIGGSLVPSVTG